MKTVEEMVLSHVIYRTTEIVFKIINEDVDDWTHLLFSHDWEEAALQFVFNEMREDDLREFLWIRDENHDHISENDLDSLRKRVWFLLDSSECSDFCLGNDLEPQLSDVYAYWIVSDWLVHHLELRREVVERGFYGLTIWGRQTTGQAISMDRAITDIHRNSLHQVEYETHKLKWRNLRITIEFNKSWSLAFKEISGV